jgi:hypothetical protein
MNWNEVPLLAAIAVGFIGVFLMMAAFVMVALQGSWKQAMQTVPDGRWSLARRLMFTGAFLGIVFSLTTAILFLIPGGIPWMDGSDGGVALISLVSGLAAVWYFIIKPGFPPRHRETDVRAVSQEKKL